MSSTKRVAATSVAGRDGRDGRIMVTVTALTICAAVVLEYHRPGLYAGNERMVCDFDSASRAKIL